MKVVYDFIIGQSTDYPVQVLCNTMQVSRSSFYTYQTGETYVQNDTRKERSVLVKKMFSKHRKRYGSRRIMKSLQHQNVPIGRYQVRSLMKEQGLKALQPKSFVPKTTNSKHTLGYAPNVLGETGLPCAPNSVYVGDITYLPTTYGQWLYLNVWIDLYSRFVVGWKVDDNMEEALAIDSLNQAVYKRTPPPGLIVHSDRAGQYASHNFKALFAHSGYVQSMSGADNPYDNAHAESFFSRFKAELLQKGAFQSKEDAITEIFNYIEMYHNTERLHSSLGYVPPASYEKQYYDYIEAERNALV
jgi:transposase InsO family protein